MISAHDVYMIGYEVAYTDCYVVYITNFLILCASDYGAVYNEVYETAYIVVN